MKPSSSLKELHRHRTHCKRSHLATALVVFTPFTSPHLARPVPPLMRVPGFRDVRTANCSAPRLEQTLEETSSSFRERRCSSIRCNSSITSASLVLIWSSEGGDMVVIDKLWIRRLLWMKTDKKDGRRVIFGKELVCLHALPDRARCTTKAPVHRLECA